MSDIIEQQVEELKKDRKILEEYNKQFSMWAMLASALLSKVGDEDEVKRKEQDSRKKFSELENSKLLEELGISVSSENDWWIILSSEWQKKMQKIKFNLTDLSKFGDFLWELSKHHELINEEIKTILEYTASSLVWQVINTYQFWEEWVDDGFLNLIWSAEKIIQHLSQLWIEQWTQDLKDILVYSRKQCLNEYVDIKNMWLLESTMSWKLYPPKIQWDVSYVYFAPAWSSAIDLLVKVRENPHANELLANIVSFWVVQMSSLEDLMKNKDSLPEHIRRDYDKYKEMVIVIKNNLLELV
jgi:hypothetical protein